MPEGFLPGIVPAIGQEDGWCFAFRGGELLLLNVAASPTLPRRGAVVGLGWEVVRQDYLGHLDGEACWSIELGDHGPEVPSGAFVGLRAAHGLMSEAAWVVAGRAAQIVAWARDHQFCGRCGTRTDDVEGERARRCPACGLLAYPRISPAVITLVERGDRILLARSPGFPVGRFGIIAGFVEPGETLEEAAHREIREEVGITVTNLRYFASQPWPFPHGIMLGFTAEWAAGDLTPDPSEIEAAGWFGVDDLPNIPPKLSIARRLIDDWGRRRGVEIPESASW